MRGFAPCTNDVPYLGVSEGEREGGQRGDVSGVMGRVESGEIAHSGVGCGGTIIVGKEGR